MASARRGLERETGIEPATNSLEGCDSTTELLPPTRLAAALSRRFGGQARLHVFLLPTTSRFARKRAVPFPSVRRSRTGPALRSSRARSQSRAKEGGEGRTRTFEAARATDLQSAAFDRFATS